MFSAWVIGLNCSKSAFLQFCADLSKNRKSVKSIWIYASESSHYTLSENDMIHRGLSYLKKGADSEEI